MQRISTQNNNPGRCLTGDVIRAMARKLFKELNALFTQSSYIAIIFSSGSMWRFQKKCKFKSGKLHGKAGIANIHAVEMVLPELRATCSYFAKEAFWNNNETGLD